MSFMASWLLITAIIMLTINQNDKNTSVLCNPMMNLKDLNEESSSTLQTTLSNNQQQQEQYTAENDEWKNVLKKMTEKNPCGSNENYTMCSQCGQWTGSEDAFYLCCLNLDGVREYCISFVNYDLDVEQRKKSKK